MQILGYCKPAMIAGIILVAFVFAPTVASAQSTGGAEAPSQPNANATCLGRMAQSMWPRSSTRATDSGTTATTARTRCSSSPARASWSTSARRLRARREPTIGFASSTVRPSSTAPTATRSWQILPTPRATTIGEDGAISSRRRTGGI
jgi:hypothetical protein